MGERVLCGLVHIEARLQEGHSLADPKWAERVLKIGERELHEAAGRAAALYAKGGSRVWAVGILDRLNKGTKTRLALKDDVTSDGP